MFSGGLQARKPVSLVCCCAGPSLHHAFTRIARRFPLLVVRLSLHTRPTCRACRWLSVSEMLPPHFLLALLHLPSSVLDQVVLCVALAALVSLPLRHVPFVCYGWPHVVKPHQPIIAR
jgi:hypothetical protein